MSQSKPSKQEIATILINRELERVAAREEPQQIAFDAIPDMRTGATTRQLTALVRWVMANPHHVAIFVVHSIQHVEYCSRLARDVLGVIPPRWSYDEKRRGVFFYREGSLWIESMDDLKRKIAGVRLGMIDVDHHVVRLASSELWDVISERIRERS